MAVLSRLPDIVRRAAGWRSACVLERDQPSPFSLLLCLDRFAQTRLQDDLLLACGNVSLNTALLPSTQKSLLPTLPITPCPTSSPSSLLPCPNQIPQTHLQDDWAPRQPCSCCTRVLLTINPAVVPHVAALQFSLARIVASTLGACGRSGRAADESAQQGWQQAAWCTWPQPEVRAAALGALHGGAKQRGWDQLNQCMRQESARCRCHGRAGRHSHAPCAACRLELRAVGRKARSDGRGA